MLVEHRPVRQRGPRPVHSPPGEGAHPLPVPGRAVAAAQDHLREVVPVALRQLALGIGQRVVGIGDQHDSAPGEERLAHRRRQPRREEGVGWLASAASGSASRALPALPPLARRCGKSAARRPPRAGRCRIRAHCATAAALRRRAPRVRAARPSIGVDGGAASASVAGSRSERERPLASPKAHASVAPCGGSAAPASRTATSKLSPARTAVRAARAMTSQRLSAESASATAKARGWLRTSMRPFDSHCASLSSVIT